MTSVNKNDCELLSNEMSSDIKKKLNFNDANSKVKFDNQMATYDARENGCESMSACKSPVGFKKNLHYNKPKLM